MLQHLTFIVFLFALGASVGSFLNVVVWRLPQVEPKAGEGVLRSFVRSWKALSYPPSHCPKCGNRLKWYDNIPVVGWIKLKGKCRFCGQPISARYPVVEAITGLIFVFYYVMFFVMQVGPCPPVPTGGSALTLLTPPPALQIARDYWVYLLYMALLAGLLAASLIDAELFFIPLEIPYLFAVVGLIVHATFDRPSLPGALNLVNAAGTPTIANALAAGAGVGLLVSLLLWRWGVLPTSFPEGEPLLNVDKERMAEEARASDQRDPSETLDYKSKPAEPEPPELTRAQIRTEMRKEMLFLLPPMVLAVLWLVLTTRVTPVRNFWSSATTAWWLNGLLGSLLGALVGAFVVWITRILGSLGFGRVAMGLGDVHLMFGVGAVVGAGGATLAFFLAPFCGILFVVYMVFTGIRREIPYGPYLSMGTALVMLFYCPIADYLRPGLTHLGSMLWQWMGG
jgi:leader peptidase (prepilin peptidase) / N-methyltransferase